MIENGWDPPALPTVTVVVVAVFTFTPLRVVSMEAGLMLTLGAAAEYALFNPFALANELPSAVFLSASLLTAFSVDVAVAPGATVEVDTDTAVAE